jgi:hypothetical protein
MRFYERFISASLFWRGVFLIYLHRLCLILLTACKATHRVCGL